MFRNTLILASSLAFVLCAGPASAQASRPGDDPARMAEMQAVRNATSSYYARIAPELAASGKPRELALAAMLLQIATSQPQQDAPVDSDAPSQPSPRDPRIDKWRALASARAGKDVLVNALLMQADTPADGRLRKEAVGRWRKLEPDNLAPLYFLAAPVDTLLADARTISRFDLHWYDQVRWMRDALMAHPPTDSETVQLLGSEQVPLEETSTMAALGITMTVAIPGISVLKSCRDDALTATPMRREDCRHMAEVMVEHSDTNFGLSFGIGLLQRLATTPDERADADERQRRLDWQMQQWGRISASEPRDGTEQFAQLLADPTIETEQELVERVLREADVALDPPPGWQPPRSQ